MKNKQALLFVGLVLALALVFSMTTTAMAENIRIGVASPFTGNLAANNLDGIRSIRAVDLDQDDDMDLVVFQGTLELFAPRNLILERASRLDAFSVYPFRS